ATGTKRRPRASGEAPGDGWRRVHRLELRSLRGRHDPSIEVTTLDALTYAGNLANLEPVRAEARHRFVHGDVTDREGVFRLLETGIDAIVHFAAESHVDRSIEDSAVFLRTNVLGTQVLLEGARRF